MASPRPTLITTFSMRGTWRGFVYSNSRIIVGTMCSRYRSRNRSRVATAIFTPLVQKRGTFLRMSLHCPACDLVEIRGIPSSSVSAGHELTELLANVPVDRNNFATAFADTLFALGTRLFVDAMANPCRLIARRTKDHHVRGMQRCFLFDDASLGNPRSRLQVALDQIHTADDHAFFLGKHPRNLTGLAALPASDH